MPKPLDIPTEKVQWRIRTDDLAFLSLMHPNQVNTVMRELIHQYCERRRVALAAFLAAPSDSE